MSNPDSLMTSEWKETFRLEWDDCIKMLKLISEKKRIDLNKFTFVDELQLKQQLKIRRSK
jgi:hypothetical protein